MQHVLTLWLTSKRHRRPIRVSLHAYTHPPTHTLSLHAPAVRVTHIATGVCVAIQDERSQIQNKAKAIKILRTRLAEAEREKLQSERAATRRGQIGSGARNERIRTYNFHQDRITDHRVNLSLVGIDAMLRGESLDRFVEALALRDSMRALELLAAEAEESPEEV
jgi:peptide chain release factor 1